MKVKKITSSDVIGFLVDPQGQTLADTQGDVVVCTAAVGRYVLSAKKRETHLTAGA